MEDIVDIIRKDGRWGVVEGKEVVLAKIDEIANLKNMRKTEKEAYDEFMQSEAYFQFVRDRDQGKFLSDILEV